MNLTAVARPPAATQTPPHLTEPVTPSNPLDPVAVRVLGSLIEKEIATPDYYPLNKNSGDWPRRGRLFDRLTERARLPPAFEGGYTQGMKTAISVPDDLFLAAERHAARTRKSRSQLYAEAVAEYLARHAPEEVTEAMNRALDQLDEPGAEPFVATAARRVLERSRW